MSAREQQVDLQELVGRLEANMDAVGKELQEIKQEIRDLGSRMDLRFQQMDSRFDILVTSMNSRFDSWLKWILGFTFTSWLTIMASIWLKR